MFLIFFGETNDYMKLVILLTDFSGNAENALHFGIQLVGTKNVKYTLMHCIYEPTAFNEVVAGPTKTESDNIKEALELKVAQLKKIYGKQLDVDFKFETEKLKSAIHKIDKEIGPDLIVVGNQKRSDLDKLLLKGNTEEIIKNVSAPVLAVPEFCDFESLKNPILASNLKSTDHPSIFNPLLHILNQHEAKLKILNVYRKDVAVTADEALAGLELDKTFEGIPHTFCYNKNKDVAEGIVEFAKKEDSNLIIMIARKHGLFDRLFNKSVTKTIAKVASFPMLILHE